MQGLPARTLACARSAANLGTPRQLTREAASRTAPTAPSTLASTWRTSCSRASSAAEACTASGAPRWRASAAATAATARSAASAVRCSVSCTAGTPSRDWWAGRLHPAACRCRAAHRAVSGERAARARSLERCLGDRSTAGKRLGSIAASCIILAAGLARWRPRRSCKCSADAGGRLTE